MNTIILRDLSLLWSLFHILILFILLYRSRYSRRKTLILTCIFMGPLIFFNTALFVLLGPEKLGQLLIVTCTIPSLVFFYLISVDQKWRFLFTFCLADTAAAWIMLVTNLLDYYLGGQQYIIMFVGRLVLFPLLEWFAAHYIRKPYLELQENVAAGWGIFAFMSVLYYILLVTMTSFPVIITSRPQELPAMLLILLLMPFTYMTIFVSLYRQLQLYRKQQEERIWQEQKQNLEARLENQQHIRKLKHDMKAHTITLSGLLSSGRIEEAQSYMRNMVYDYEQEIFRQQFCVNPYLDSVFSHFFQKFEKAGIEMEYDIQIGEEELPFMELCQIISNGLENAWDAVKELSREKQKVSVQMRYNQAYLMIRIKNCCKSGFCVEKGKLPASTREGAEHGFGLLTIRNAARKLGGEMMCYTADECFFLDVMIKAKQGKQEVPFSQDKETDDE